MHRAKGRGLSQIKKKFSLAGTREEVLHPSTQYGNSLQDGHNVLAPKLQKTPMRVAAEESCEAEDVCRHPEVEQPRDQGELGGGEAEPGEREVLAGVGAEAGQLQQGEQHPHDQHLDQAGYQHADLVEMEGVRWNQENLRCFLVHF